MGCRSCQRLESTQKMIGTKPCDVGKTNQRVFVLRLAIGNAATTEDDVRVAWEVLRREAARLGAGAPAGV